MLSNHNYHFSVLATEAIEGLNIKDGGIYVDCTFGRGGHSKLIDQKLNNGTIIVIDKDLQAIEYAQSIKLSFKNKLIIVHDDFVNINKILKDYQINYVDGFLFDLGVSSPQLDDSLRGFSYCVDTKLDMRMNQTQTLDATVVLNTYSLDKLIYIFQKYGDCYKHAHYVANAIIKYRQTNKIETTFQFCNLIRQSLSDYHFKNKNPIKQYFQAIRIEVNNELDQLENTLIYCASKLNLNARMCVISFHSLEDRIVKYSFLKICNDNDLPNYLPIQTFKKYKLLKTIYPSSSELKNNSRSHSAKLRIIERISL